MIKLIPLALALILCQQMNAHKSYDDMPSDEILQLILEEVEEMNSSLQEIASSIRNAEESIREEELKILRAKK
jgi:hypothetical protein